MSQKSRSQGLKQPQFGHTYSIEYRKISHFQKLIYDRVLFP